MKVAIWFMAVYSLALTAFAAYEYARIDHLKWVISILLAGSPN